MTTDLLSACQWPPLSPSYALALREAVAFILEQFEVYGIIVSGSIIRGNPHPSSDFDMVVIHAQPERQRLQRLFRHVPTEIFLNPPKTIRRYFEDEQKEGKPSTAHMLATGFVILDRDPVVNELREQAQELIARPPDPNEIALTIMRYGAADNFENALDIAATEPTGASLLLGQVIPTMVTYAFLKANRHQPRHKELLTAVRDLDPELADELHTYYTAPTFEARLSAAKRIADRTIGTRGFFEWETPLAEMR